MGTLGSLGFRCHQFTTIAPKTSISINAKLPVLRILGSAHFNMTNNTPLSDPLKGMLMVVMEGKCCKLDERGGCLQCTTAAWRNDRLVGMRNDGTSTRLFRSSLTHLRIHGNRTIWTSIGSQRPSLLGSDSERSVAYEPIDHRKSPPYKQQHDEHRLRAVRSTHRGPSCSQTTIFRACYGQMTQKTQKTQRISAPGCEGLTRSSIGRGLHPVTAVCL